MQIGSMFIINASDYPTIQSAIDAGNLLSQSESGNDPSGVLVLIPGGNYDENIVVTKNTNLASFGAFNTTITSVFIKPSSAEVCPQNLNLSGIYFSAGVTISNQTEADSGIFNPNMGLWGIVFSDCFLGTMDASNVAYLAYKNCNAYGDQNILNVHEMDLFASTVLEGVMNFQGNNSLPNQPMSDDGSYVLNTYSSDLTVNLITGSGSTISPVRETNSSNQIVELRTITNSTDPGLPGEIAADSSYIYICTAVNTWLRSSLSSW